MKTKVPLAAKLAIKSSLAVAAWAGFCLATWKVLPMPAVWATGSFVGLCGFLAAIMSRPWLRFSLTCLLAPALSFGMVEYWQQLQVPSRLKSTAHAEELITTSESVTEAFDADLGFNLPRSLKIHDVATVAGRPIYDSVYSLDKNGFRVVPGRRERGGRACVLFFGCSFMFGKGLNDDQTLAAYTSNLLGPEYQVTNLGINGAGPHQSLAILESGLVERITDCADKPVFVVMGGISDHVLRAAGKRVYNLFGPRYELDQGKLERRGNFWSPFSKFRQGRGLLLSLIGRSQLVARLVGRESKADRDRYDALLVEFFAEAKRRFAGSKSALLFWDPTPDLAERLASLSIPYVGVPDILPPGKDEYQIREDGHPNARANAALAQYVAKSIVGQGGVSAELSPLSRESALSKAAYRDLPRRIRDVPRRRQDKLRE